MSETNDEKGESPTQDTGPESTGTEGEVDLAALAGDDDDAREQEEEGLDLSDLDALGVEGMVAQLRSPDGGEDAAALLAKTKARPQRSPIISLAVVAFGAYLLISMFSDFRYWMHSSEAVDLGHVASLLEDGRTLDAYENQFVVLEGTPDVQHAARLTTKEQFVGYLRVTEGDGSLFAAVPRAKDQPVTNNFQGRYEGRLRRAEDDRAFEWLSEFYANEKVTRTIDLNTEKLLGALGTPTLPGADGNKVTVEANELLRLAFDGPDARVQLGKTSFEGEAAAEEAVAALGYPYVALEPTSTFYRFVVRIPEEERADAQQRLNAGLEAPANDRPDPKIGAFVLALPTSYGMAAGQVRAEGDAIMFPYGDNTTTPGYVVEGDRLVERTRPEMLAVTATRLRSARIERIIEVDPEGFVIAVGERPSGQWITAIFWVIVLAITGANIFMIGMWWRRRTA